jgi:hypothetical protein
MTSRALTVARYLGQGVDGGEADSVALYDGGNPATTTNDTLYSMDGGTP